MSRITRHGGFRGATTLQSRTSYTGISVSRCAANHLRRDRLFHRDHCIQGRIRAYPSFECTSLRPFIASLDFRLGGRLLVLSGHGMRTAGCPLSGVAPTSQSGCAHCREISSRKTWINSFARQAMTARYRGARFARIRCSVRRCIFSLRAVSETLRLHIS